ncbi:microsomal signal peptidase 25 kDa subunit-domain-containing protein [Acrodontium crateriforme]|uniref:Signal peptidase complex subunit 2 n=1 Tax=Acrodontium crateriforme TaxID=150365 RepID=A0AAQ3LYS0_9PEZI|nr:microsomal signal peptidase 25 kDa subunit-domain-containing protein [Acrodontium crateriforme]
MSGGDGKVSPYSLGDLKNTTDDALGNYLRGLSFTQDNSKLDIRLAMGYVMVVIAGAIFVADYKLGWEATKTWTAVGVAAYTLLNGAFTFWMWGVEKGLVFEGTKNGHKISIKSKSKKYDPTYYISVTNGSSTREIQAPFTRWFTADGYFEAKPFQRWLAGAVKEIGEADPKNAKAGDVENLIAANNKTAPVKVSGSDAAGTPSKRSSRKV